MLHAPGQKALLQSGASRTPLAILEGQNQLGSAYCASLACERVRDGGAVVHIASRFDKEAVRRLTAALANGVQPRTLNVMNGNLRTLELAYPDWWTRLESRQSVYAALPTMGTAHAASPMACAWLEGLTAALASRPARSCASLTVLIEDACAFEQEKLQALLDAAQGVGAQVGYVLSASSKTLAQLGAWLRFARTHLQVCAT